MIAVLVIVQDQSCHFNHLLRHSNHLGYRWCEIHAHSQTLGDKTKFRRHRSLHVSLIAPPEDTLLHLALSLRWALAKNVVSYAISKLWFL